MTNIQLRKKRIEEVLQMVRECSDRNTPCDENKLIAHCMYKFGYTKRILEEYLAILRMAEQIEDKADGLWIKNALSPLQ